MLFPFIAAHSPDEILLINFILLKKREIEKKRIIDQTPNRRNTENEKKKKEKYNLFIRYI